MQKVTDNRQAPQSVRALALARAAETLRTLLGVLDGLGGPGVDRAHADRVAAIEEAARLVAGAAEAAPSSLRPEPLRNFAALVMRLAVECQGPPARPALLTWNHDLASLEARHGSLSSTLMGVALALSAMQSALGGAPVAPAAGIEGAVRVPRDEVRAWARSAVSAVSRLERDVLMRTADPALRRDAWALACLVSIALAHVSDHGCVDARAALDRVAESGAVLCRAVALRSSQVAGGSAAGGAGDAERSCLALVEIVEQGVRLLSEAVARRDADATVLAWRLIARGRTGLGPDAIFRIAVGSGRGDGLSRVADGAALARAAARYEAEWAA